MADDKLRSDDPQAGPEPQVGSGLSSLAKVLGFAASGGLAFLTDAMTLETLTRVFDMAPQVARVIAIALAMVVGWFAHRTMTFQIARAPTIMEFLRYAAVAWSTALINYLIFVGILWQWPDVRPLGALVFASLCAMILSYLGMKFGVFNVRRDRA
jgi:putative flippase GtrA